MKLKRLTLILLSVFILSACGTESSTDAVTDTLPDAIHSDNVPKTPQSESNSEPRTSSSYSITAYLEKESIIIKDTQKLLEVAQNCLGILPESERQAELYQTDIAKEKGLLIQIDYNTAKSLSVDVTSLLGYPISYSCDKLYLAVGPSNWIGIQEEGEAELSVLGFQNEENITDLLSSLEITEEQKEFLRSMEPEVSEPDFENEITITAFSEGQEIAITDPATLLKTAEVCADYDQQFNTVLFTDSLEELKSEELWIHISYKNGRNIYPAHSLGPHAVSDLYIIIGNHYYIQSYPLYDGLDSLMGFRYVEGVDDITTLRSCVDFE